jgi:hypothetical protein
MEARTIGFHKGRLVRRALIYAATAALSLFAMVRLSPATSYYSRTYHEWRPLGEVGYAVLIACALVFLAIGVLGLVRVAMLALRRHGIAITPQGLVDNGAVARKVTEWPLIASVAPCTLGYRERGFSPRPVKGIELQVYPLRPDGSKGEPYARRIGCGLLDVDTDRLVSLIQEAKAAHEALQPVSQPQPGNRP